MFADTLSFSSSLSIAPLQNRCRLCRPPTCARCMKSRRKRCDGPKAECSCQDLRLAQMDTFRVLSASDMGTKLKRHSFHSPRRGGKKTRRFLTFSMELNVWPVALSRHRFISLPFMSLHREAKPVVEPKACTCGGGGALKSFGWLREKLISHLYLMPFRHYSEYKYRLTCDGIPRRGLSRVSEFSEVTHSVRCCLALSHSLEWKEFDTGRGILHPAIH